MSHGKNKLDENDLRRIAALKKQGVPNTLIAERFGVAKKTIDQLASTRPVAA